MKVGMLALTKKLKPKKLYLKKYNVNLCCIVEWKYDSHFIFSFQSNDVSGYVFPLQIITLTTS
jgi:hypothetical protein